MSSLKAVDRPSAGLPLVDPEEVGFSSQRLARIGPSMQKYIDSRMVPGVLTMAARHGKIVHLEVRGLMDMEANKPLTTDAIYRLASMTKPISCVALMMLYEEGHFLLDEPISKVLPSFKKMVVKGKRDTTVPAQREITFRDCLTQTAGFSRSEHERIRTQAQQQIGRKGPVIPCTTNEPVNTPTPIGTAEEVVEQLANVPLNYHPGTDWEYNPAHDVVGVLVEKISGQSLDDFFKERIFGPLKMVDTHFYLPQEKVSRFSAGYSVDFNEWGKFGLVDTPATSAKVVGPTTFFSGTGGLVGTAADYARFAQALLNGGALDGARILGRKTVELMTTNHTGDHNIYVRGPGYGYGLGLFVRKSMSEAPLIGSLGTYGWGGAYCTLYFADPKEDLFGLIFTQVVNYAQNPALTIRPDFERMVYQALVD